MCAVVTYRGPWLRKEKLDVTDVIVFLDREQGGSDNLKNENISVHSVISVTSLLEILTEAGSITKEKKLEVENFIQNNKLGNYLCLWWFMTKPILPL